MGVVRFPIPLAIGKTSETKNLTRMGDKGDRDEGHVKVDIRHPDRHSSLGPSLLDMLLLSCWTTLLQVPLLCWAVWLDMMLLRRTVLL